jgi:hypothetical protein
MTDAVIIQPGPDVWAGGLGCSRSGRHERGTRTDKAGGQRTQRLAIHGTNLVSPPPLCSPRSTLAKAFCGLLTVLSGYSAQYKNCSQGGR